MKKIVLALLALILLGLTIGLIYTHKQDVPPSKKTVKIGVTLPLSGDVAYMGVALRGALELLQEDLQTKPLKNNYQFIFVDNKFDTHTSTAVLQKLLKQDRVDAILDFTSLVGQNTYQILSGSQNTSVLHINACASDLFIADNKTHFVHTTRPTDEASLFVQRITGKYKRPLLVYINEPGYIETAKAILSDAQKENIPIDALMIEKTPGSVSEALLPSFEKDYDLYIPVLRTPYLEKFLVLLKENKPTTPIRSTHGIANISDLKLIDGLEFVAYGMPNQQFQERIVSYNMGKSHYKVCTGNIYDAGTILITAFEKTNTPQEAALFIQNLPSFTGVMGDIPNINGVFTVPPTIARATNGDLYPLPAKQIPF